VVEAGNTGSLRVMQKAGFERFTMWKAPDSRAESQGQDVTLIGFAYSSKDRKLDMQ